MKNESELLSTVIKPWIERGRGSLLEITKSWIENSECECAFEEVIKGRLKLRYTKIETVEISYKEALEIVEEDVNEYLGKVAKMLGASQEDVQNFIEKLKTEIEEEARGKLSEEDSLKVAKLITYIIGKCSELEAFEGLRMKTPPIHIPSPWKWKEELVKNLKEIVLEMVREKNTSKYSELVKEGIKKEYREIKKKGDIEEEKIYEIKVGTK